MQEWSDASENVLTTSCKSLTVWGSTHMWYHLTEGGYILILNGLCKPPDSVYLTRHSAEGNHDRDRLERLRYDSERPSICLCVRKITKPITRASNNCCDVCLIDHKDPRTALDPCGHQRVSHFCESCTTAWRQMSILQSGHHSVHSAGLTFLRSFVCIKAVAKTVTE